MALQIPGYRVIRKIAQGGMSSVYLAIQISVGRVVALKVMNPHFNSDPAFSERFQREANIVGQLSHPNIVSIYDIGRHDDFNYIAMDYLPNGSVHDKMQKGISAEEALRITREIASALDHAHEKGYVHRDIKPENILFRADNSAVLSDFGVARGLAVNSRMTHVGTVVGTPHYMSPEQTKGKQVDGRSDLYSLGIVLYEMLTGIVPYQGDEAVTIALKHLSAPIPKLPMQYLAYQRIIDKLLAKDPDQRFQRGRDLILAIEELEKLKNAGTTPTLTHPSDITVVNLLRALASATLASARWRWNKLRNLRLSRERGFYFRQPTKATDIFFNEMHKGEKDNNADTGIRNRLTTQIHGATVSAQPKSPKWILAAAAAVLLIGGFFFFKHRATLDQPISQSLLNSKEQSSSQPDSSAQAQTSAAAAATNADQRESASANTETAQPDNTAAQVPDDTTGQIPAQSQTSEDETASNNPSSNTDNTGVDAATNATSSEQQAAEVIPQYALTVNTDPGDARVRILNIRERYQDGIALEPGPYHIEVSRSGYQTYDNWVRIEDQNLTLKIKLDASLKPGTEINSPLTARIKSEGPDMISIPAGSFYMGDKNDPVAMPVHKVTLARAFAISKFEITFDDYDIFAQATNRALPDDNRWGRGNRPVINVSFNDAVAYSDWLSKTTGKKYRLPTEAEWEYVARAKTLTPFWWGDNVKDAAGRANCRRGCSSKFSGLFGAKTAPVGSYPANGFGVFDTAGNVAEWVQDCYAENYATAPNNGQAYEIAKCAARVVRGGSAKDSAADIASYKRDYDRPEIYNEHLGFRVVMEL